MTRHFPHKIYQYFMIRRGNQQSNEVPDKITEEDTSYREETQNDIEYKVSQKQ